MRRGGARREVTERVTVKCEGRVLDGWALNVSRGGLRVILEEKVTLGERVDVVVGTENTLARAARVVWVQEEPDGVIVGFEFVGISTGSLRAAAPASPPDED